MNKIIFTLLLITISNGLFAMNHTRSIAEVPCWIKNKKDKINYLIAEENPVDFNANEINGTILIIQPSQKKQSILNLQNNLLPLKKRTIEAPLKKRIQEEQKLEYYNSRPSISSLKEPDFLGLYDVTENLQYKMQTRIITRTMVEELTKTEKKRKRIDDYKKNNNNPVRKNAFFHG